MDIAQPTDHPQARLWNGPSGHAWVDTQAVLDGMFQPFEDLLTAYTRASGARRVLDVGCGTGSTTLAIARVLGAGGRSTGVDVSAPMILRAEQRARDTGTAAHFVCADAELFPFASARFELLVSRFGVMFFADPVRAFANLRRAARPGARFHAFAWRSVAENPFMTTAERAAAPLLPTLSTRAPDAPGQFAFADPLRIRHILHASGWTGIDIQPLDVDCTLPEPALLPYLSRMGPVGLLLQETDDVKRAQIIATVRAAFGSYVRDGQVRFTAACWQIDARAPFDAPTREHTDA
jgi:SAM-dependent methyltransferase